MLGYAESIFALGEEILAAVGGGSTQGVQRLWVGSAETLSRNFQENFPRPVLGATDASVVLESGGLEEFLPRLGTHRLDLCRRTGRLPTIPGHRGVAATLSASRSGCRVRSPRRQSGFPRIWKE